MQRTTSFYCKPQTEKELDDIIDVLISRSGSPVSRSEALGLIISEYHSTIRKETDLESKISALVEAVNARQDYKVDRDFVVRTVVNHWYDQMVSSGQIPKSNGQR
jgi:hypothetical protein